eukprot:879769-Pleurochrysis_carterae.AAC.1
MHSQTAQHSRSTEPQSHENDIRQFLDNAREAVFWVESNDAFYVQHRLVKSTMQSVIDKHQTKEAKTLSHDTQSLIVAHKLGHRTQGIAAHRSLSAVKATTGGMVPLR